MSLTGTFFEFRVESPEVKGRCEDAGNKRVVCQEKCDLANERCWQKVVIEKCSCTNFLSHLVEIGTFKLDGAYEPYIPD